jgi:hypothetical protein
MPSRIVRTANVLQLSLLLFPERAHPTGSPDRGQRPTPSSRPATRRQRPVRRGPRRPRPGELAAATAFLTTDDLRATERFAALRVGQTIPMDLLS